MQWLIVLKRNIAKHNADFFSLKHFGHLSRNGTKTRRNSIH